MTARASVLHIWGDHSKGVVLAQANDYEGLTKFQWPEVDQGHEAPARLRPAGKVLLRPPHLIQRDVWAAELVMRTMYLL